MRNKTFRLFAAIALAVATASAAFAYDLIYGPGGARVTWDAGQIPFVIRMSQTANLQDGSSYATSVQAAMSTWNAQVTNVQFAPELAAPGLATDGDGINEIAFDTKIYSNAANGGQDFGENVLAVTLSWTTQSPRGDGTYRRTQSDILFNSAWNWNSYRGNLQQPEDIRRVAVHELGHVLGLDHPDQDGQTVTAIMNAYVSNIESPQADDLTGAQLLYGRAGGFSPPRNDNLMYATPVFLNNNSATVSWTSIGATREPGEPHHGHSNDGASIWWKWNATANGTLTINTLGTNFDTVLAAYTGEYINTLTQLAANDDTSATERRSTITFNVTAGTAYSIAVAGWDSQWGIVVLNVSFSPGQTDSAPTITTQPLNQSVQVGQTARFGVGANGSPAPSFRWQRAASGGGGWSDIANGGNFSGTDSAQLAVVAEALSMSGDRFRCVVSNVAGSATSAEAALTVLPAPPQITSQPLSRALTIGQSATFNVAAATEGTLNFQWRHNGQNIAGATAASFTLNATAVTDGGYYEAVVTNVGGSTRSVFYVAVAPANATAATWGYSTYQDLIPPAGAAGFVQVAAGVVHSLGLKADGTVVSWGDLTRAEAIVPAGLTNVVRIAARSNASAALRGDGTVVVWGGDYYHQTEVPAGLINVVDVAVGGQHCLALKADGTVVAWGSNSRGQTDVPAGLQNVVGIAAGEEHSVALLADQTLVVWGGSANASQTPPAGLANVKAIAAGEAHNLALKADGTVVAWGFDYNGQATVPAGLTGVVAIAAGQSHSLALKSDGTIVAFGHNFYGQRDVPSDVTIAYGLGAGNYSSVALVPPVAPSFSTQPANATVNEGATMTFSVSMKGRPTPAIQWRKNGVPLVNGGRISGVTSLTLRITGVTPDDAGNYDAVATSSAGTATSAAAIGTVIARPQIVQPLRTIQVSSGDRLVVDATATVSGTYSWRHNDSFLSFTGSVLQIPSASSADSGFYAVTVSNSAGSTTRIFHVHVTGPNRVVAWGANESGQTTVPEGLKNVSDLVAGNGHAAALRSDGTVVAWGRNDFGQCNVPTVLSDVVQLAAGGDHTLALKSDGSVVAWGRNSAGQATVPPGLNDVVQVAAGGNHSVALKNDGTVVAWGANDAGQAQVPNALRMTFAIAAGERHTFVFTDLGFTAWGSSDSGELNVSSWGSAVFAGGNAFSVWAQPGTGQLLGSGAVITPSNVTQIVALSARGNHYLALKASGDVLARGQSSSEQSDVPASLGNVQLIATGGAFFAAALAPEAPKILRQPLSITVAQGTPITFTVEAGAVADYRWFKDGAPLADGGRVSGSGTATLIVSDAQPSDEGLYRVRLTNVFGEVFSTEAALTVQELRITINPSVAANTDASQLMLSISATGPGPFSYQWYSGQPGDTSSPVGGATGTSLTVPQTFGQDSYWVRVTSSTGSRDSAEMMIGKWSVLDPLFGKAELYATTYGGGRHVVVGDAVGYSPNGTDWKVGSIASGARLFSVLFDGTRFIAAGPRGQIYSSDDGATWQNARPADAGDGDVNSLSSGAFGNGSVVFVGDRGQVMAAASGSSWAWRTITEGGEPVWLRHVVYAQGQFVAVGEVGSNESPRVYYSVDGVSWTRGSLSTTSPDVNQTLGGLFRIAYFGGRFVAIGRARFTYDYAYAATSTDGVTWTPPAYASTRINPETVAFAGNQFVAEGFRTSSDGLNWSNPSAASLTRVVAVGYNAGTYVAVQSGYLTGFAAISSSSDLATWTKRVGFGVPGNVTFGGDRFAAVSRTSRGYSMDGKSWTVASQPGFSYGDIAYGAGLFVACDTYAFSGSTHHTSPDGITWTARRADVLGEYGRFLGTIYAGGQWVAWGGGAIYTSADAVQWTRRYYDSSNGLTAVAYGDGRYVGVGYGGFVVRSTNGIDWTTPIRTTNRALRRVTYGNGVFVAQGDDTVLLSSVDGAQWVERATFPNYLSALAFGGGRFLASRRGDLVSSVDGVNWQLTPGVFEPARTNSNFSVLKLVYAMESWWAIDGSSGSETWMQGPVGPARPQILSNPADALVAPGNVAVLSITATGSSLRYQWYRGETGDTSAPISGANSASYTTPELSQTTRYWVQVGNGAGSTNSATITVAVGTAPQIQVQPADVEVAYGTAATVAVSATGNPAPTYQWYRGTSGDTSSPIIGATGGSYSTPATLDTVARVWARVSNGLGAADSAAAIITPWFERRPLAVDALHRLNGQFVAQSGSDFLVSSDGLAWDRRSPTRRAADFLASNGSVYVGYSANSGKLATSPDLKTWTDRTAPSGFSFGPGLAFGAGQFVCGSSTPGGVMSSPDGFTWTRVAFPSADAAVRLESVIFDGRFIGCGRLTSDSTPVVMTSEDGVNWVRRAVPAKAPTSYVHVAKAGALYFVFGDGIALRSTNAADWIAFSLPPDARAKSAAFFNGAYFVGTDSDHYFKSNDALVWEQRQGPRGLRTAAMQASETQLVAANGEMIYATVDGENWILRAGAPAVTNLSSVASSGDRFVLSGFWDADYVSLDGVNWEFTSTSIGRQRGGRLLWANGRFYCTDTERGDTYWTSPDGAAWQSQTISGFAAQGYMTLGFANSSVFALGSDGTIATTVDGVNWTSRAFATTDAPNAVAFGAGRYALFTSWDAWSSSDLAQWTETPLDAHIDEVVFANGVFVAGGYTRFDQLGALLSSADGVNWTNRCPAQLGPISGVKFSGDRFVATSGGTIATSLDGLAWHNRQLPFVARDFAIAPNSILAIGSGGLWQSAPEHAASPIPFTGPASHSVAVGGRTAFSVGVDPKTVASYQWEYAPSGSTTWTPLSDGNGVSGARSAILRLSDVTEQLNGGHFRVVLQNGNGTSNTSDALLSVVSGVPVFVTLPQSIVTVAGGSATFTCQVTGSGPFSYRWFKDADEIAGASSATLLIPAVTSTSPGTYSVRVANVSGSVAAGATLELATLATIAKHPASSEKYAGETVVFSVEASANSPISYHWRKGGTLIDGATSAILTIAAARLADAGEYSVDVTTMAGTVASTGATLTVRSSAGPVIAQQPVNRTVALAARTVFTVAATGIPTPSYRWQRLPVGTSTWIDVVPGVSQFYSGETTPTLMLNVGTLLGNNGDKFRCIVSNVAGSVTSDEATLTVTTAAATLRPVGGYRHSAALRLDGSSWATGRNQEGQLGNGTTVGQLAPVQVQTSLVSLSAGADHTAYLKADGTLWTTGYNPYGGLGTGTTSNLNTPQQIATSVSQVEAGQYHTAFVKTDGTLWTTGWNADGQLGDGTTNSRSTPVQVATDVVGLSANYLNTMFVRYDGTAWAMGGNSYGQFGNGTTTGSTQPVQIASGIKSIVAGYYHSFQIGVDGTLRAAGNNNYGQLGDGTTLQRNTAVPVATDVIAAAGGVYHSVFLKSDGTVWTMGSNTYGQLGDGTNETRTTPVQVASGVASIGAGLFATYVVKNDGSLWAAGYNPEGQLGDGTASNRNTFVQISGGGVGLPADYVQPTATNSPSATRLAITWAHARGTLYYRLLRHTANDSTQATVIADRVVGNFFADASAAAGVNYYYWVQPVNQFGALGVGASALGRFGVAGVAPTITTPPTTQAVTLGASVTFSVVASGTAPLRYQWRHGGSAIENATASSYTIVSAQLADAGTYDVVVTNDFGSATSAAATLSVNKLAQSITFAALPDVAYTNTPIALTASASSSLPVSFALVSGPATLTDNNLTVSAAGTVTVRASQSGNGTFLAAADVERTFTITKAAATVTLSALSATYDGTAKAATATTTPADLSVVLTYDGNATAPTNAGSYAVSAVIADTRYQGSASGTLAIARAEQTITFSALSDRSFSTDAIVLSATSSSSLPVSFSLVAGPASLDGNTLTLTGAGIVTVRAAQTGNGNYFAAPTVDRSFTAAMNFEAWRKQHFNAQELLDGTISGPGADPDGDGFANLVEYGLGTDPRVAFALAAPQIATTASDWTFTYARPSDRSDLAYTVEYSTDLLTWISVGAAHTRVATDNGTETWRATYPLNSASKCFFRLVITR